MKTTWNGTVLLLEFEDGREIHLNISETKEFEAWVMERVKQK